jgi:hypothetical protein
MQHFSLHQIPFHGYFYNQAKKNETFGCTQPFLSRIVTVNVKKLELQMTA